MNVGAAIRRIRLEKRMSQTELADKVGVRSPMICQIERGTKSPSFQLSVELAEALGCTLYDFMKEA